VKSVKPINILVLFFFFVNLQMVVAQNEKCITTIVDYIDAMTAIAKPNSNATYHLKYTTIVKYHKELQIPDVNTTSEIMVSHQKQVIEDPNMKVYADAENVFVVIPRNKLIYWNNSDPKIFEANNAHLQFLELEKGLLKSSKVTCASKEGKLHITLIPESKVTNQLSLIRQQIVYNNNLKRIEKVTNYFNKKSKINVQTTHYEILDYNSKRKIKKSSKQYVFSSGKLRPIFSGYKLIDNRKK